MSIYPPLPHLTPLPAYGDVFLLRDDVHEPHLLSPGTQLRRCVEGHAAVLPRDLLQLVLLLHRGPSWRRVPEVDLDELQRPAWFENAIEFRQGGLPI